MAHVITSSISETECIGDSLNTKINPNFLNLDNSVQSLSTSVQSLSTNKNIFTGNVGIGTSSPTFNLDIEGNIRVKGAELSAAYITLKSGYQSGYIGYSDLSNKNIMSVWQTASGSLVLGTNDSIRVNITSGGNVGIGGFEATPTSNLTIYGSFATPVPTVVTTSSYTVPASATSLIHSAAAGTYTLPNPALYSGRWLFIKTVSAVNISSASPNVEPLSSLAPRNTILPQTGAAAQGKWVNLQSDGTDWVAMAGN